MDQITISKKIPPIGQRIIKSFAAVFLCFVVYYIRGKHGTPFYSALAVLQCMQPYHDKTLNVAKNRIRGTFTGAFWGAILIAMEIFLFPSVQDDTITHYIFVSLFIGLVIYSTVLLKITQSSYFSCVVYLSIVVNHMGDANPWMFVVNRVVDTLIGIGIAFLVNESSYLPREKHNDILFVSGIDDTLLNNKNKLLPYSKIELNRMINSGANFTVATRWTPASIRESLGEITFKYPIIVMNGAALYDMNENTYLLTDTMSAKASEKVIKVLDAEGINYYSNVILDDTVLIYYKELKNDVDRQLYMQLRKSPYRNYIKSDVPPDTEVVYFMIIDETDRILELYHSLKEKIGEDLYQIIHYESKDFKGASYIKIYNKEVSREKMLEKLKQRLNFEQSILFGTVKKHCDILIEGNDYNQLVKTMKRYYEPISW